MTSSPYPDHVPVQPPERAAGCGPQKPQRPILKPNRAAAPRDNRKAT